MRPGDINRKSGKVRYSKFRTQTIDQDVRTDACRRVFMGENSDRPGNFFSTGAAAVVDGGGDGVDPGHNRREIPKNIRTGSDDASARYLVVVHEDVALGI